MDDALGHGLPRVHGYARSPRDSALRVSSFIDQLKELKAGTHIFIDHPAVESAELQATSHPGYEDVFEDRTTCLDTLTSIRLKDAIDQARIELISYRDL